eukprot:TRINITY_DN5887_c0_g1_i2.p5 TRINITY_DN5887_c0_g1~~TRINITY_DN5887_c0_g1_i2.p5  ORF type:complete len:133 (+),score=3.33 TRINITY_DN5887_c0_g1_i2:726-1124(+)
MLFLQYSHIILFSQYNIKAQLLKKINIFGLPPPQILYKISLECQVVVNGISGAKKYTNPAIPQQLQSQTNIRMIQVYEKTINTKLSVAISEPNLFRSPIKRYMHVQIYSSEYHTCFFFWCNHPLFVAKLTQD